MEIGDFVAFNLLLALLVMPLRMLGMWIGQAQRATASGERIFQVMDEPEEVKDAEDAVELPPGDGPVHFENVSLRLRRGTARAGGDRAADIEAGLTIALIGHTGSGKTTLASLVPRFYDATRGPRRRSTAPTCATCSSPRCAAQIGVIPQDPFLFSDTVRENIAFGATGATDEEVEQAARLAQAHEFIAQAPGRLRHGDRGARDHAFGRPAPADRDRARAHRRPAHPHPRRRDRVGGRDDRGAHPARAARGR